MIKSFKHKGLEKLFVDDDSSEINPEHIEKLENILYMIDSAENIQDLNTVSFKLHPLKGNKKGIWSITVRANWRITFRFENGNAYILNYEDYH
jgi:proteic killer suppression protein